jgi:hypothetical protein
VWRRFSGTAAAAGFTALAIPAVIGGILGTTIRLARVSLDGWLPVAVFAASLAVAIWRKPPAWLLIPVGGLVAGLVQMALG